MHAASYRLPFAETNPGERADARAMGAQRWLVTGASGQLGRHSPWRVAGERDSSGRPGLTREGRKLAAGVLAAGRVEQLLVARWPKRYSVSEFVTHFRRVRGACHDVADGKMLGGHYRAVRRPG